MRERHIRAQNQRRTGLFFLLFLFLSPAAVRLADASSLPPHASFSTFPNSPEVGAKNTSPRVRVVYLVPSDRLPRPDYRTAIAEAARSLQGWFHTHLGNGKTFRLSSSVVEILQTTHPASYYATQPHGDSFLWFWNNVLGDGFPLTGGQFNDPEHTWIYYIDADPDCGQIGGAGTSGVAVLPANDLRGLTEEGNIPACPDQTPDNAPVNRWIGGLGHELGHAFNLPHPPGCDEGLPSCDAGALMWLGFRSYPNTYLTPQEILMLDQNPFFQIGVLPLFSDGFESGDTSAWSAQGP